MQNEWYKEKYIKRKNKVRKIITYNDESVREKHSQINRILNENSCFLNFPKLILKEHQYFIMLNRICIMIFLYV